MKGFTAVDEQTACCTKSSKKRDCGSCVLTTLYAATCQRVETEALLDCKDFHGALYRVCRLFLLQILCLFGAIIVFTICFISINMSTSSIIRRGGLNVRFELYPGMQQGLPLYSVSFIINEIFAFFGASYDERKQCFDALQILIHAE